MEQAGAVRERRGGAGGDVDGNAFTVFDVYGRTVGIGQREVVEYDCRFEFTVHREAAVGRRAREDVGDFFLVERVGDEADVAVHDFAIQFLHDVGRDGDEDIVFAPNQLDRARRERFGAYRNAVYVFNGIVHSGNAECLSVGKGHFACFGCRDGHC